MRRFLLSLVAVLMVAAACGGGDDNTADTTSTTASTTTTTDPGLPKDEFIRQANAICADMNAKVEALPVPRRASDYTTFFRQGATIFRDAVARLRALRAPAADRARLEAELYTLADQQVGVIERSIPTIEQAVASGSESRVEQAVTAAVNEGETFSDKADTFSASYGLTECVSEE